ncbi:DEAD/DEAH box helicase family protein [Winogradskyella vincentii]|uniref:DEAD/DEAH box helicase family protein n=1 Tax=Winogradskyella vincentii TaxID=2877122 RepID=A0ABS7Y0Z8_9FLAO|nr:DEAD/DEAH box helicase family protein [Winogradskyella vincentii]MCA0152910.1 DEAD/DEAH box helicase family protein [Winogradskyella vincentii]
MSNFQFLHNEWPAIFKEAKEAEQLTLTSPKASVLIARSTLEKTMHWLYDNDVDLEWPYDTKLSSLIHAQCFREIIKPSMFREINLIRLNGNAGAHGKSISHDQSIASIKNLFRFLSFLGLYYSEEDAEIPIFTMGLIPDGNEHKATLKELQSLEQQLDQRREKEQLERKKLEEQANEIELLKKQLEAQQIANKQRRVKREKAKDPDKAIPILIPESVTRKLYIDVLLKEAGWENLKEDKDLEYEVTGMPISTNPSGIGYVDYVLWGKDGKPLAVVEAKKTMADARKGRHQAELYADCLEQMHAQRPIIFYTNGFETFIWDDTFYTDREIQGFYTQNELQLLVDRRTTRKDPRTFKVNTNIAGRDYQLESIKRVAENLVVDTVKGKLRGARRESLLVMATGSGKTRVATAIVDMLTKCNWAKRILFLADRNALVSQAKNAFREHLPELSAIDLTKEKEDNNTRLVFSTYPTIINKIDKVKTEDQRFYGVGHFDLIIIDEAHRSVYHKYRAIFEYFDAMLLGLTATPKKDIDRNTYSLFGIEDDNPTFAYELDRAVNDGFLTPPKSISVPLKFQREGIKYHELSEAEKLEYEEKFGDPTNEEAPDTISSGALNKWLFNTDTVDKVLDHLMTSGIKVSGGDKLGKTIIFAKNHKHAIFIEERFNKNYPEYGGKFLRVIDNYETKAQDLLEKFVDPYQEQDPQIAVSVDMMDTGVDAPRVVNLVFFKLVRSASKFWQMIGRGTRLCPDLFGPGEDKKEFLIFDYCQNFEFFDEHPDGANASNVKPLLQQIFEAKLKVTQLISDIPDKTDEQIEIRDKYLEELHASIKNLDHNRFVVRKQLRYVTEYSNKSKWLNLSKGDVQEINTHLSHLQPANKDDDELARRFDILVLIYQLLLLSGSGNTGKYITKISNIATALQGKTGIPDIVANLGLIKDVQTEQYWETINVKKLEELRVALRELIKYLDIKKQKVVVTHFTDQIDLENIVVGEPVKTYITLKSYKDRVETYIRKNKDHLTIHKLCNNIAITKDELNELEKMMFTESVAGTKEDFVKQYGEQPLGSFIRSITGLNEHTVNEAFADFLQTGNLRADQITFIRTVMSYLTKNGTIDKQMLFEPPFTDLNDQGLIGVFENDADVTKIVKIIDLINNNAEAG